MLVLQSTDTVQVALGQAIATSQLEIFANYRDIDTSQYTPGKNLASTNGVTFVNAIPSPSAGVSRVVDFLSVFNSDTINQTVTVRYNNGTLTPRLFRAVLQPFEKLEYQDGIGFRVLDTNGSLKQTNVLGSSPIQSGDQTVVLASAVVNNNATANTIANITGLSFPVIANQRYQFEFFIRYLAQATTTGARFTINGPAFSELTYDSDYSLTATSRTVNSGLVAYDQPATSNASSTSTTGNIAVIRGIIRPTVDGVVIGRFASEISASAITVQPGSLVSYRALI
jgi:hypothetical protein